MMSYLRDTRHPWACLLFLLPLLAFYEGGLIWLGGDRAVNLRNGADAWLRWALQEFGARQVFAAPAIVIVIFLLWSWWRWADRPEDPVSTYFGMALESCIFSFVLWQFGRNFLPLFDQLGIKLQLDGRSVQVGRVLTYVGAGIYEEVLFRLGLFSVMRIIFRCALLPDFIATSVAAVLAAVAFAAAHHLGPTGEPVRADVFVFRTLAGLFFTTLFVVRGFGIGVGAHAGYDVLVGVTPVS